MQKLKLLFFIFIFLSPSLAKAQAPVQPPRPENVKVLDEYSDGRGNLVRVVQFSQGLMRVTQTIIMPKKPSYSNIKIPIRPDTLNKDSLTLVVDKSEYSLRVVYKRKIVRVYKAVFGPRPLDNKCMEGDRCTPEGKFRIASKNPASKYDRFMGLNYPNDSTYKRFNALKAAGSIPATARIGGDVGIHGIWPGGDDMIEMGIGWTDGCIALKNKDIEELFTFVGIGTKVIVQK